MKLPIKQIASHYVFARDLIDIGFFSDHRDAFASRKNDKNIKYIKVGARYYYDKDAIMNYLKKNSLYLYIKKLEALLEKRMTSSNEHVYISPNSKKENPMYNNALHKLVETYYTAIITKHIRASINDLSDVAAFLEKQPRETLFMIVESPYKFPHNNEFLDAFFIVTYDMYSCDDEFHRRFWNSIIPNIVYCIIALSMRVIEKYEIVDNQHVQWTSGKIPLSWIDEFSSFPRAARLKMENIHSQISSKHCT